MEKYDEEAYYAVTAKRTHKKENGEGGKEEVNNSKKKKKGFQSLGLASSLLRGVLAMGYKQPTPVQRSVLPAALAGRDIVGMARTGSGKTAAFLIPTLQMICKMTEIEAALSDQLLGVCISPTRELALQTYKFMVRMGKYINLSRGIVSAAIVGGESLELQFEALTKKPRTLVCTPGRLVHLLKELPAAVLNLDQVRIIIFDEADRLFEMGFAEEIRSLLAKMTWPGRQTMLFSATMPSVLAQFARAGLRENAYFARLDQEARLSDTLRTAFFFVRPGHDDKTATLFALLRKFCSSKTQQPLTIVFVATRHHCEYLLACAAKLMPEYRAICIYGALDQMIRNQALESFRKGRTPLLFVTDVAARGIDIPLVDKVIHYSFPPAPRLFVHRAGRAARQGRPGEALALVEPDELAYLIETHELLDLGTPSFILSNKDQQKEYDWIPTAVHCGRVPQPLLDAENDLLRLLENDIDIQAIRRTADNGLKAYRKSRRQPSRQAVQKAKALFLANNSEALRAIHPLFFSNSISCDQNDTNISHESLRARLAAYRPPQTVFEVTAETGTAAKVAHKLRSRILLKSAQRVHLDELPLEASVHQEISKDDASDLSKSKNTFEVGTAHKDDQDILPQKRKLSKAERKRLKRGLDVSTCDKMKAQKKTRFKDETNYLEYGLDEAHAALSTAKESADTPAVARLEAALLELAPDEALDMAKKQRIFQWDSRKRKYIQQTLGDVADGDKPGKTRTESGAVVSSARAAKSVGDRYQKWQQNKKRGIPVQDDHDDDLDPPIRPHKKKKVVRGTVPNVKDEVRNADQIVKHRLQNQKSKLKNMPKGKRRALTFGRGRESSTEHGRRRR
uniref:RNA helicase n=1 Tax=Aureoumbra lagunensis TaxID=44058 RepID=A0A7S3NK48_9STRA|mmetsp:Transcript_19612/g.29795  ORF Transcript_19612/g.29795 Transcript_19612/m.29795 type:complete len:851 (+) Transcript_19612:19-2571(+)